MELITVIFLSVIKIPTLIAQLGCAAILLSGMEARENYQAISKFCA